MCWNTHIRVVLQKDTPAVRARLPAPPANEFTLEGGFPDYRVTNSRCGCGTVVEPDGGALKESTLTYLRHFLAQPAIKRVEVRWWWGDEQNRPEAGESRLELAEFESRNAAGSLEAGVTYRVNNPEAFQGRKG